MDILQIKGGEDRKREHGEKRQRKEIENSYKDMEINEERDRGIDGIMKIITENDG